MSDASVALADVLLQKGEHERAQRLIEEMLKSFDKEAHVRGRGDFWYLRQWAVLYALLGRDDEALTCWSEKSSSRTCRVYASAHWPTTRPSSGCVPSRDSARWSRRRMRHRRAARRARPDARQGPGSVSLARVTCRPGQRQAGTVREGISGCRRCSAAARVGDVVRDGTSQRRTMLHGIAEVHAAVHSRIADLVDELARPIEVMRGAGDGAVERELDALSAEERFHGLRHRTGDAAMRGRVLGVRWRVHERQPGEGSVCWIAVDGRQKL